MPSQPAPFPSPALAVPFRSVVLSHIPSVRPPWLVSQLFPSVTGPFLSRPGNTALTCFSHEAHAQSLSPAHQSVSAAP